MANSKISALTDGNPAQSGDEIPIARGGANYKITAGSIASLSGNGDVVGPASATDNAVARFDGITGKLIQNSVITIEDDGSMVIPANSTNAGLRITQTGSGNALSVEDSANPDATPFVIDAGGTIVQGNANPISNVQWFATTYVTPSIQGLATGAGHFGFGSYVNSASTAASLYLLKSRGATVGTNTVLVSGDKIGDVVFSGNDGSNFIRAAEITAAVDGTPGTNDMPGRLVFSTTADGASSPTERMRIDSSGAVGIGGGAPFAYQQLGFNGTAPSSGLISEAVSVRCTYSSASTSSVDSFVSRPTTEATSYTLSSLRHFRANPATFGAGSTVSNQYGFIAESSLTGATNNYGFYSNIASGTGRYNFYAGGTADNYFAGKVFVGNATSVSTPNYGGGSVSAPVQIQSAGFYDGLSIQNYIAGAGSSTLMLAHSRGGTIGTQGIVANNDYLGAVNFSGSDGIAFIRAAQIQAEVDGTPGTNDMPGRLVFSTTADGASIPTERMRIDNQGRVGIGATPSASTSLRLGKNITGGTSAYGVYQEAQVQSATVTNVAYGFQNVASVSAGGSLSEYRHFDSFQGTLGITPTNQYSFYVNSNLTGATNNYGFYSNIASGTGRWNFYASGTAANYFAGDMQLDKTVTAAGTTGAQTINKNAGTVNFAAAATSLVVTDSRVTANSIIICTVGTDDTTMKSVAAVAGAGSFTLHANAAATAETRVNFLIIN